MGVQTVVLGVLKKVLKEHKRIVFDGDGYSQDWHKEAEKRGLPHLRDSVEAFPVLKAKKTVELFKKSRRDAAPLAPGTLGNESLMICHSD